MKKLSFCVTLCVIVFHSATAANHLMPTVQQISGHKEPVTKMLPADTQASLQAKTASRAETTRKATRDEILGGYIYDEFRYLTGHTGWEYMFCIPEIVAGDGPDEVILNGFWADYDTSVNPPRPISQVKATFDYDSQTITIPAGSSLGRYGDYPAYIYVSDWATDIMQPDPIVLNVDAATRAITYYCEREDGTFNTPVNCLIVTSEADAVGKRIDKGVDFIGAIIMNKYNGIMSATNVSLDDTGYMPVYTETEADRFTVYNFGGYGYEIGLEFTADISAGTCTAPVTLWREGVAVSDELTTDVYFASTSGDAITGTIKASDTPGTCTVNVPSWSLYNMAGSQPLIEFANGALDISFDTTAGITGIATDKPADTPVQYFDLTGRRLITPVPGSVVIAISDGKASKIILH